LGTTTRTTTPSGWIWTLTQPHNTTQNSTQQNNQLDTSTRLLAQLGSTSNLHCKCHHPRWCLMPTSCCYAGLTALVRCKPSSRHDSSTLRPHHVLFMLDDDLILLVRKSECSVVDMMGRASIPLRLIRASRPALTPSSSAWLCCRFYSHGHGGGKETKMWDGRERR
jgi:hypothetical protein